MVTDLGVTRPPAKLSWHLHMLVHSCACISRRVSPMPRTQDLLSAAWGGSLLRTNQGCLLCILERSVQVIWSQHLLWCRAALNASACAFCVYRYRKSMWEDSAHVWKCAQIYLCTCTCKRLSACKQNGNSFKQMTCIHSFMPKIEFWRKHTYMCISYDVWEHTYIYSLPYVYIHLFHCNIFASVIYKSKRAYVSVFVDLYERTCGKYMCACSIYT